MCLSVGPRTRKQFRKYTILYSNLQYYIYTSDASSIDCRVRQHSVALLAHSGQVMITGIRTQPESTLVFSCLAQQQADRPTP